MELIAIITKHGKEKIIQKELFESKSQKIIHIEIDTDKFGTFTNYIKRKNINSALENKIKAGLKKQRFDIGIASEGSFYPHPTIPGLHLNTEHILYWNIKTNHKIIAQSTSYEIVFDKETVTNKQEIDKFLEKNEFPSHGIIVEISRILRKNKLIYDITTKNEIYKLLTKYKKLILHTDQRSHKNPSRQKVIKQAVQELNKLIQTT
jgi:hypothetical protein